MSYCFDGLRKTLCRIRLDGEKKKEKKKKNTHKSQEQEGSAQRGEYKTQGDNISRLSSIMIEATFGKAHTMRSKKQTRMDILAPPIPSPVFELLLRSCSAQTRDIIVRNARKPLECMSIRQAGALIPTAR